jgi:phosphoribosyl-ATP pyrophosphohydrolase
MQWLAEVRWDAQGLVPVIAQEQSTGDVLMFAWMDREALRLTAETGRAVYFSRSRGKLWFKGEESGHVQLVHEVRLDCDNDVVLLKVTQQGHDPSIACHTGRHSCFFQLYKDGAWHAVEPVLKDPKSIYKVNQDETSSDSTGTDLEGALARLAAVIKSRKGGDPEKSYVARLLSAGSDAVLKKIGEEATEAVMAAKDADHGGDSQRVVSEVADLWFHCMIALARYGLSPADVIAELNKRAGTSGIEEKALRKAKQREQGER